jgi:hypothetical protein
VRQCVTVSQTYYVSHSISKALRYYLGIKWPMKVLSEASRYYIKAVRDYVQEYVVLELLSEAKVRIVAGVRRVSVGKQGVFVCVCVCVCVCVYCCCCRGQACCGG